MGTTASKNSPASDDVKLLYSTSQRGADVDIIVVRVLPQSSDDSLIKPHHHWSEDYLYPEELQSVKSRILVFGLSTNLPLIHTSPSTAKETLEQQAFRLLELLYQDRKTAWKTIARPLIFVAHGLAGMVVDKALEICIKNKWKFGWRQPNPYVLQFTYAVFLFSHNSPLGWTPRSWQPMKLDTLTGFEHVEQNRLEIETLMTSSCPAGSEPDSRTLRCLHHALWSHSYWSGQYFMRRLSLTIMFLGQIYFAYAVVSSPVLVSRKDSIKPNLISHDDIWQIFPSVCLYHLCANYFFHLKLRDKYQNKVMILALVITIILAKGLDWMGADSKMIFLVAFSILTSSLALSALAHLMWPVSLANEEGKSWAILERWVEDVSCGGGVGDGIKEKRNEGGIV